MMEKHMTEIIQGQPYHIKLIKSQRDVFGWEITVYGTDMAAIIEEIKKTNDTMTRLFQVETKR